MVEGVFIYSHFFLLARISSVVSLLQSCVTPGASIIDDEKEASTTFAALINLLIYLILHHLSTTMRPRHLLSGG